MIFKLLVVDDEVTMRKGISNYMNWASIDCQVVGNASDGVEAMEFLDREPVDIVITDIKMPAADGLEVARYVYEHHPHTKVIILTGYADFQYAQTAIKYRVTSFILKPTNKKELFAAVQEAQKQLIISQRQENIAKEGVFFLKDQLMQELTDHPCTLELKEKLQSLGLTMESYYVAAFKPVSDDPDLPALKKIIIEEKQNSYCYRYNNLIINIYFQPSDFARPIDQEYQKSCSFTAIPDYIIKNCQEISGIAKALGSTEVLTGISALHQSPEVFQAAVSEAIQALTHNFYSEQNISVFHNSSQEVPADLSVENSLDLYQIESSLNNWDFTGATSMSGHMFSKFKSSFTNSQDAKNICSQIYYICCRVLVKKELEPVPVDYLEKISKSRDIFALENTITDIMEYTKENSISSHAVPNYIIENTLRYISQNLSGNLSLDAIAGQLHISPSHLSRTFKKAALGSLTEYINKERIEKAKELLQNTDLLTYEIAESVGYKDATYFSSIFRKYEGISPSEYKAKFF